MELSTELDKEKNILIIHVRGEYRRSVDSSEAQQFFIDSYSEFACRRVLLDLTQAEITGDTMSTFNVGSPPPERAEELRKFCFACVYPEISQNERFFENVAVNRGFRVRVFDEFEKAVDWLEQCPNDL